MVAAGAQVDEAALATLNDPSRGSVVRLRAALGVVAALTQPPPAVVLFEDLHWADPESVALFERLRERTNATTFIGKLARHRRGLVVGVLSLVICIYLAAAQWVAPHADRKLSFLPLTQQIQTMQANGQEVALYQANERTAGASVFYTQSLLKGLETEAELSEFLTASPNHVALMASNTEPPASLKVLKKMIVGKQDYYFVGQ